MQISALLEDLNNYQQEFPQTLIDKYSKVNVEDIRKALNNPVVASNEKLSNFLLYLYIFTNDTLTLDEISKLNVRFNLMNTFNGESMLDFCIRKDKPFAYGILSAVLNSNSVINVTPDNLLKLFPKLKFDFQQRLINQLPIQPIKYFIATDANGKNLLDYCTNNKKNAELILKKVSKNKLLERLVLLNPANDGQMTFQRLEKLSNDTIQKLQKSYDQFLNSDKTKSLRQSIINLIKFSVGAVSGYDISAHLYNDVKSRQAMHICFRKFVSNIKNGKIKLDPTKLAKIDTEIDKLEQDDKNPTQQDKFYTRLFEEQMPFIIYESINQDKVLFKEFTKFVRGNKDISEAKKSVYSTFKEIREMGTIVTAGAGIGCMLTSLTVYSAMVALVSNPNKAMFNSLGETIKDLKDIFLTKVGVGLLALSAGMFIVSNMVMMGMEMKAHKELINDAKKHITPKEIEKN